jgi:hypothetical protein
MNIQFEKLYKNINYTLTTEYKDPLKRYTRNVFLYGPLIGLLIWPFLSLFRISKKKGILFSCALMAGYSQPFLSKYLRNY